MSNTRKAYYHFEPDTTVGQTVNNISMKFGLSTSRLEIQVD